ncbi:hypothetical protein [Longimicrobium sp.]|uniref:hypothetical protein n=1 Tax=Longimicrobium sp. TaxID=2029185 RepID=UPI003B3B4AE4
MNTPHRTAARLVRAATLACALLLALPARAAAQEAGAQEDKEPRDFCWRGRPQSSCEMVAVVHFSYYPPMPPTRDLGAPWEWEFGLLVNRGPAHAVGGTVSVGMDGDGTRTALKARYRRWLSRYAAVDASGGLALATSDWDPSPFNHNSALGVTGDVAVGFTDWASVGVRGDLLWRDGEPLNATYGTVRLGTTPGLTANALAVLGFIVLIFTVGSLGD